jgi:GAF domain-containing protein
MSQGDARAAVAAGQLAGDEAHAELLTSVTAVARAIFGAAASSIFMFDEETDELVFAAVSGEGEESLVGTRFPAGRGLAGWVLVTRQPIVIEDVPSDQRFARDVAERAGYIPNRIMSAPLLHGEDAIGVIQVLDPPAARRITPTDLDLLSLFANQAAIGLHLARRARRARGVLQESSGDAADLALLTAAINGLEGERRAAALALVRELARVLDA